jgi:hypothetical protein
MHWLKPVLAQAGAGSRTGLSSALVQASEGFGTGLSQYWLEPVCLRHQRHYFLNKKTGVLIFFK